VLFFFRWLDLTDGVYDAGKYIKTKNPRLKRGFISGGSTLAACRLAFAIDHIVQINALEIPDHFLYHILSSSVLK